MVQYNGDMLFLLLREAQQKGSLYSTDILTHYKSARQFTLFTRYNMYDYFNFGKTKLNMGIFEEFPSFQYR